MPKLTKRGIEAAMPAPDRDRILWDSELRGFGLRIKPSGQRTFLIQFRNTRGRSRRLSLGKFGVLTVDEARRLARAELVKAAEGVDPVAERAQERNLATVKELADRYLREHARTKKKTAREDERALELHVLPRLKNVAVKDVTWDDVATLHHAMNATPYKANRTVALLSKMFSLAERWGLRPRGSNPARGIDKYREHRRERFLSELEFRRLGKVLDQVEKEGSEMRVAVAAIRFLLFTGCRRGEALNLRWSEVDLDRGLAFLSDSKTGAKPLFLNQPAKSLLQGLPRSSEWVFTGRHGEGPLVGLHRPWERIRAAAKIPDVRLHDLRHSHASAGAAAGLSLPLLGALLGHRHPATTARYAHLAAEPVQAAAEQVGARVAAALGTPSRTPKPAEAAPSRPPSLGDTATNLGR